MQRFNSSDRKNPGVGEYDINDAEMMYNIMQKAFPYNTVSQNNNSYNRKNFGNGENILNNNTLFYTS